MKKIAVFGGSFNPPGIHHIKIVQGLARYFDEIIVVPCGPRPDKETTNGIELMHRGEMTRLAFGQMPKVRLELFDIKNGVFTRTRELQKIFEPEGEIWHVVGADLIAGGSCGDSQIQTTWADGQKLWENLNFAIVLRSDFSLVPTDFPPHSKIINSDHDGSSTEIRKKIKNRELVDTAVPLKIKEYIKKHNLYN